MAQITITERVQNIDNVRYLRFGLDELFERTGCEVRANTQSGRVELSIDCPDCYADVIRAEILDRAAEVIAIKYKYDFFRNEIKVGGLSSVEKEILYASLIAADLEEDKRYSFEKLKCQTDVAIDGFYNFRLSSLRKKWADIVSYMPNCFVSSQLKDFITFLIENKKSRIFVDEGRVYDEHYRRLTRANLLNGEKCKIVREIILSNCKEMEIKGQIPDEDEKYLKEFYGEKIIFSPKYYT